MEQKPERPVSTPVRMLRVGWRVFKVAVVLLLIVCIAAAAVPLELNVAGRSQYPNLPNGCEAVAAAVSMEAMGVPVTAESFADQYLPKAPVGSGVSPEEAYIGEPTSYNDGYYCLPPALALGINRFLDTQNTSLTAKTHRLTPFSEIALRLHLEKKPVIVWLTSDDKLAQRSETVVWQVAGREYHPYTNLHAVVVDGVSGFKVHLVDSINGARWMPLTKFLPIYYSMGLRAVYFTD